MIKLYSKSKIKNKISAIALGLSLFGAANAQITYTFTTAGVTGSLGPTQSQINTAYASTNLNGMVTSSLGIQSWTVPSNGAYIIEAYGAQGGNTGGLGAKISGNFTLTAGTVLRIVAGQEGSSGTGSGGGGGSYVVVKTATTPVVADILVIAGGGGSATDLTNTQRHGQSGTLSGASDLQVGSNGGVGGNNQGCIGGGGGFLTDGNINNASNDAGAHGVSFINGCNGGLGVSGIWGGFGGGGGMTCGPSGWRAGGGGFSGGAGGGVSGGGGSSYNNGASQVNTAGFNSGPGKVIITQLYGATIAQTASIACNGFSTAAFSATVSGGTAPYTYTWLPTGGNTNTATGLAAGVYTLTVKDFNNQITTAFYTITQPTALTSSLIAVANASCFGNSNGSATVQANGGTGPYSYTWSPTGGNAVAAASLTAGTYTCQIKDANLCSSNVTVNVTQPAAIGGAATSSAVCNGGTVALNGTGATSYTWTGSVVNGVAFTPTASSAYTVVGSNSVTGCTGTAVVNVAISPNPVITITNPTICVGQTTTLNPSGAATYTFSGGSPVVNPSSTTVFTVSGTSSVGCLATPVTVTVVVSPCTGIQSTTSNEVKLSVYPNPSNGLFTIESNASEVKSITVTDVNGKLIEKLNVQSNIETLDIRKYDDGVYFIKVTTVYGDKTMKVIKSK